MKFSTFVISLGLTLLLELPVVYLWGVRKRRDLTVAVLVNVLTNPVVVLLHALGCPALPLEIGAIAAEGICYRACGEEIRRPYLLALCANVFSYSMGLVLNLIF